MKTSCAPLFALLLMTQLLSAQKKPLDHTVYDSWQSISHATISNDGHVAVYCLSPQEGDTVMVVTHLQKMTTETIERGSNPQISDDSQWLLFKVKPTEVEKKEAKRLNKESDKMQKDTLGVMHLPTKQLTLLPGVQTYKMPKKEATFVAYTVQMEKDTTEKDSKEESNRWLIIHHFSSKKHDSIPYVDQYSLSNNGKALCYITKANPKDSSSQGGIYLYNVNGQQHLIQQGAAKYHSATFDEEGRQLAYFVTQDTAENRSNVIELYYSDTKGGSPTLLVDTLSPQMPHGWGVNPHHPPFFSRDGKKLYFGLFPIPEPRDTTLDEHEMAALDIWHYDDDFLPPFQLKNRKKELNRQYLAVINLHAPDQFIPLGSPDQENIITADHGNSSYALAYSSKGYRKESQWTGIMQHDVSLISTENGKTSVIGKAMETLPQFSPMGNYLCWFNRDEAAWYLHSIADGTTHCLTNTLDVSFENKQEETPDKAHSFGMMGWSKGDEALFIYDEFDIWQFDPTGKKSPRCVTKGTGRKQATKLRYIHHDPDEKSIETKESLLLSAFNKRTKEAGFYTLHLQGKNSSLVERTMQPRSFSTPKKGKKSDLFLYTKGNFNHPYDVWITSDRWKNEKQLSKINPQMDDFNWGTAELISWDAFDGEKLEGVLYKPEDFNPEKRYPLLVYFYERHSDELYQHFSPSPSKSIINIPFFCSRGYLVFTPDIRYSDGYPGKSAYNAVVSGTEHLARQPWVDKNRIGMQGQSWGGYQVSYLITQTHLFAAAAAGAPVANMTSAYGGIRWNSGITRQMQYERQQSRIGKSLWEDVSLYIENSPLFFADKVETPLLIMHNDQDGAVPWYQGIEYFTALRRLGKKVWMLQYNNEAHNLKERRNMKDLSVRLQQFFDHYLMDAPMPVWMKKGVPAVEKGKKQGYELLED